MTGAIDSPDETARRARVRRTRPPHEAPGGSTRARAPREGAPRPYRVRGCSRRFAGEPLEKRVVRREGKLDRSHLATARIPPTSPPRPGRSTDVRNRFRRAAPQAAIVRRYSSARSIHGARSVTLGDGSGDHDRRVRTASGNGYGDARRSCSYQPPGQQVADAPARSKRRNSPCRAATSGGRRPPGARG